MSTPGARYVRNFREFRQWLTLMYPNRKRSTEAEIRASFGARVPDSFPARVWWGDPPMDVGPSFPVLRSMTLKAFRTNPPPPPPPPPTPKPRLRWPLENDVGAWPLDDDDFDEG